MVRIVEIRKLSGSRLFLRFDDGACGEVDIRAVVPFEGVFSRLEDPREFEQVVLDTGWGTIRWGDDLDLAPEGLREKLEPWPTA